MVRVWGSQPAAGVAARRKHSSPWPARPQPTWRCANTNSDLRHLAVTDPLTGLANRTLLFDHLELAIAQRARDGRDVAVLFCDVDGFKQINDGWGHETGDRLLRLLAERLLSAAREVDTVARLAGDEFVVICPGLDGPEDLGAIVERVTQAIRLAGAEDGQPPMPDVTIGSVILRPGETADEVLRRADGAMYDAKPTPLPR